MKWVVLTVVNVTSVFSKACFSAIWGALPFSSHILRTRNVPRKMLFKGKEDTLVAELSLCLTLEEVGCFTVVHEGVNCSPLHPIKEHIRQSHVGMHVSPPSCWPRRQENPGQVSERSRVFWPPALLSLLTTRSAAGEQKVETLPRFLCLSDIVEPKGTNVRTEGQDRRPHRKLSLVLLKRIVPAL